MIRCVLFFAVVGLFLFENNAAYAQTGGPPKFKIEYGFEFPNSKRGIIPLRVRMSRQPALPLGRDQIFTVVVSENWGTTDRSSKVVSSELVIAAGQTSAEVVLYVQHIHSYNQMLLIENGRGDGSYSPDDLLHTDVSIGFNGRTGAVNDNAWLIVSSNVKSTKPTFQTTASNTNNAIRNFGIGTNVNSTQYDWQQDVAKTPGLKTIFGRNPSSLSIATEDWHAISPTNLPETWVGLSSIDYVLIEHSEFASLCESPGYRELFENWVGAGGSLVVFNKEKSLSHAGKILPALLGPNNFNKPAQWTVRTGRALTSTNQMTIPTANSSQAQTKTKSTGELSAADLVASRPYLRGEVIAIVSPESLGKKIDERSFVTKRPIGKSTYRIQEFNHLSAVPGVGKPPITLFAIATGLFLFLIGPVILVVVSLNNDRRHYFYAVPITSFITCSCILGYAVVADFNKQWARTETVTTLDQKSGRAFTEATSAYYCGNQPSYYAFDNKTLFATAADSANGYKIRQLENEARLSGAKIQPRRTHEVYAAKPILTEQKFLVAPPKGNSDLPQVTNLLGGHIKIAGFEYSGQYFLIRDIEHQKTATAERVSQAVCRAELGKSIRDDRPAGGSPFFTDRGNQNVAIQLKHAREFAAVLETNPAIAEIVQPFEIKLQTHIVHGRF